MVFVALHKGYFHFLLYLYLKIFGRIKNVPTKIIRIYLLKYQMRLALPVKTQARLMVLRIKEVIERNACIQYRSSEFKRET